MSLFGKDEPNLRDRKAAMGLGHEEESGAAPPPPPPSVPRPQVAANSGGTSQQDIKSTSPTTAYCRICKTYRSFNRCWIRLAELRKCPNCGVAFPNPEALYERDLPACPKCGEYLEHPGFQYGLCDGCGSKYELMTGTAPSMLPNQKQRAEMEKFGKSWSKG